MAASGTAANGAVCAESRDACCHATAGAAGGQGMGRQSGMESFPDGGARDMSVGAADGGAGTLGRTGPPLVTRHSGLPPGRPRHLPPAAQQPPVPSQPPPPGAGRWPLRSHMTYGPLLDTVPTARARTKALLREWGAPPGDLMSDVLLVVSELVSNAITASRALREPQPVRLWLRAQRPQDPHWPQVLVLAGDHSPHPPLRVTQSPDAEHGRGLAVVQALSAAWGWYPATSHGLTKVVWALIGAAPAPPQRDAAPARLGWGR